MRPLERFAIILVLAFGMFAPVVPAQTGRPAAGRWHSDYDAAQAEARRLDLPLLVHFYADWCAPCRRMQRDVLSRSDVLEQLDRNFVGVKLDSERHEEVARRLGVNALPSDVVVDPKGNVLAKWQGYQTKQDYLAHLARADARSIQSRRLQIAQDRPKPKVPLAGIGNPRKPKPRKPVPQLPQKVAKSERTLQKPLRVGLDGYCPVALWNWRHWKKGKTQFLWPHKSFVYRLSSAEALAEFKQKPERYVPRLEGCDPVVLWETDRAVKGSTRFGAYYNGDLFLFRSQNTRRRFKENPARFARTRHVSQSETDEKSPSR